MHLEILEEKRNKSPPDFIQLLDIVSQYPFWIKPALPKKRPIIIDKICLMELGLTELQAEILLTLWEIGDKLPIWGEGIKDLCHELNTTSATIKRHLIKLIDLGFVNVNYDGNFEIVGVKSPDVIFKIISKSLNSRFQIISEFFKLKQKEFDQKSNLNIEIIPESYTITSEAKKSIERLNKLNKIVCGFVIGNIKNKGKDIIIENFISIKTRSGPKIHFNPMWKDYHRVKNDLIKSKKWIIGEFHTHTDNSINLHKKDKEKMKMLSRGIWWILNEEVNCYYFRKNNNRLKLIEIPNK